MSHQTTLKQTAAKLWVTLRHDILVLAVFLNGLLIFKTTCSMPVSLLDTFHIEAFSELDLSLLANTPLFMLGVLLVLNSIGLLFRVKFAWTAGIILLLIVLIYTLHFYPRLRFSIESYIFTLVFLLVLRRDFSHSSVTAGTIFAFISFTTLLFYSTYDVLYLGEGFNSRIESLMTAFYFSIETMSTVGYGDIVLVSESARLFTISVTISDIAVFTTSMTPISGLLIRGGFNELVKGSDHTMHRRDYFIVCGHSIFAVNTIL